MAGDIFLDHLTSHSISDRSDEIPIFPHLPPLQTLLQTRELAKQPYRALGFNNPHHLSNPSVRPKRDKHMNMLFHYFDFDNLSPIFLAYIFNQLFRSFPNLFPHKYIFSIFRAPHQMIARIIDRMTRSFQRHPLFILHLRARAYAEVIPSTHSSGDKTYHGKIVWVGNRWLRWAAVEAVWPAIRADFDLRFFYERLA
jgi:hypothetical protein